MIEHQSATDSDQIVEWAKRLIAQIDELNRLGKLKLGREICPPEAVLVEITRILVGFPPDFEELDEAIADFKERDDFVSKFP